jgi:DNA-binding protein WhiA
MSFTAGVKAELAGHSGQKRCCVTAELGGLIFGATVMTLSEGKRLTLTFRTESAAVLRRALKLFNATGQAAARPRLLLQERVAGRRQYLLQLSGEDSRRLLKEQGMLRVDEGGERFAAPRRVMRRNCCRRAYLRGSFLACGYLSDPRRRYHAEWVFNDQTRAQRLRRVLGQCGLLSSTGSRRGASLVILKGGDQVSELLKLMDAPLSVLSMENSRVEKSLREGANRAVNCDQANLGRQLGAAQRQIAAIEALSRARGLGALPSKLEAIARLRLGQPDVSLDELGGMMQPPLSKSGAARLMWQLKSLADALQETEK